MGGRRVAAVGAGMTRFVRRAQETGKELSWQAAKAALDAAEMTLDDIDCVAMGTAPDAFDGVHMKGEYLSDGAGAFGKPFIRTYVGGGSGVFTAIQAWYTVASGMADVVLAVAEEKMSSTQPHPQGAFLTIFDSILERPLGPNLLWIFALEMNRYMTIHGLDKRDIAAVAVKNKRNAADHPAALLGEADITVEDVPNSETLAWPDQRLDVSPVNDGAVAMVLAADHVAKRTSPKPVWVEGVGWHLDTAYWTNRDLYYPRYVEYAARQAYEMAGIREPRKEIHLAEPYDPFDYKELHHLEGLLLFGREARQIERLQLPGVCLEIEEPIDRRPVTHELVTRLPSSLPTPIGVRRTPIGLELLDVRRAADRRHVRCAQIRNERNRTKEMKYPTWFVRHGSSVVFSFQL